jgi:transposase
MYAEKYKIFMDETKPSSSGTDGPQLRVRRLCGTRHEPRYIDRQQHSVQFSLSIHFWAAITWGYHTPLVFVHGRGKEEIRHSGDRGGMDSQQYVEEVLEPFLLPFLEGLPNQGVDYEVMEDLSGPHRSAYTYEHFYSHYQVQKSLWPAKSPDLNPIENVWSLFKGKLKRRFQKDGLPRTLLDYIMAAQQEWKNQDWEMIDGRILDGMERRVQAVLEVGGEKTKY